MYSMVKRLRTLAVVGVAVALVASACGGAADEQDENAACPPKQEPTGVTDPEATVESDETHPELNLSDNGFRVAKGNSTDIVTYGLIIENPSDLVLYDATIRVEFRDADGNDPFEELVEISSAPDLSTRDLDDVEIPVIMPGEQIGLGDWIVGWQDVLYSDRGDPIEMERPDYDDLSIDIALTSGSFWPEHNDMYKFVQPETSGISVEESREFKYAATYSDGARIGEYVLSSEVSYSGCKKSWAFHDSSVLRDEDGAIVGGGTQSGPGKGPLLRGTREDKDPSPAWGPEGDVTAEVFQYAKPLKVNLK